MALNKKLISVIYPESDASFLSDLNIPSELEQYINQLEKVNRFNHKKFDHPGMVIDNTKIHTLRCVFRAGSLNFAHNDLARTLWVHDIPEHLVEYDLSAIERYHNPKKAKEMEAKEKEVAKNVLSDEDFNLYENFGLAEDFLRREGNQVPNNQQALIANTIDLLDGNLVYVFYGSKWLMTHDYHKEGFLGNDYKYPLEVRERFLKAVENSIIEEEVREAIKFLFDSYINVVGNLWNKVEINKIPPLMRPEIVKVIRMAHC